MTAEPLESNAPVDTAPEAVEAPPLSPEDSALLQSVVDAAMDRKAEDLKVLHLGAVSDFTDHFVICSGTNDRQVKAIADSIADNLRNQGRRPLHMEGYNLGRWILLDYADLVVHVFLDESRQFYALERLWDDAPERTSDFVH